MAKSGTWSQPNRAAFQLLRTKLVTEDFHWYIKNNHVIKYTLTIYIPGDYSLEATRTSLIFYLFKKGKRLLWIRNMLKSSDLKEQKHITPFLKRKEGFEPVLHSRLQVSWYSVTLFDSDLFSSTVLSFKPSKGSCVKYFSHWLYHCSEFLWSAYWERNKSY